MLRSVQENEIRRAPDFDQSAIEVTHAGSIAGGKAKDYLRGNFSERRERGNYAKNSQRLNAGAGRCVRPQDHPIQLVKFFRDAEGKERGAFISVVNNLQSALGLLAQSANLRVRQRGMPALDMNGDV